MREKPVSRDGCEASPAGDATRVAEHVFRREFSRMVAMLTGILGVQHLTLVEDVVQEALARALQIWPYRGVPENPSAWIVRVSRNLAMDVIRRETVFHEKKDQIARLMASQHSEMNEGRVSQDEIGDDALKLMFVCCHPLIPVESQVALTLKILCGFSAIEIGRALLASEAAIEKRLTRARKTLRESRIPFEIPRDAELTNRLDGVLRSLYLLFNEGYKATCGDSLIRKELCDESIRLCALLARSEAGDTPTTHALLSLMLFHAARLPGRVNEGGYVLRLKEQDRSRWDGVLMRRGMVHFARSGTGTELSEYHLEAGIAACHCAALTYKETDWRRILWFYDRLIELNGSPVIALNRAIVVGMLYGPEAGLAAVAEIQGRNRLEQQHLFHAVLGDFLARRNDPVAAASRFRTALNLVITESEREFLLRRLKECEEAASFSRERTPQ